MKVEFEFSVADLADTARRSGERSQAIRDMRWQGLASWAALLSLALFLLLEGSWVGRAVFAGLFWVAIMVIYPRVSKSWPDRHYLKYYQEHLGGDGPFVCEVVITPEGVTTTQFGAETRRQWSGVKDIVDSPGAVEFVFRVGGMLVVRDRAFTTPQQRLEFLAAARAYLAATAPG
jgi:hypothetical protein